MDDDRINNEFDDLLKKRYEDHTIEPEKALWEDINMRLYQKKIDKNLLRVRQLRVAISAIAAVLIGVFVYFEIKTQKYQPENQPISEIPGTPATINNTDKNLLILEQNNQTNGKKSDNLNNKTPGKFIPESKENKAKIIKATPSAAAQFFNLISDSSDNHAVLLTSGGINDSSAIKNDDIQPIANIILPEYMQAGSLKIIKPITSVLPGIVRSGINNSVNLQISGSNVITQGPEKSNQANLMLSEVNQGLTQSGGSTVAGSVGKHTPFFIEGFVSPEISYRALLTNTKYSIPDYGKTYFNKKEKPDFTFSAGVSGGFGITDKLILRTGIFYSRYSLKFKTEAFHLLNTGFDGNLVYTSSGQVNITLISSDSLSNESLIRSSLNFSYLTIPVIAELHFKNNYFFDLGLNLNMLVGQNMNWQAEDYDGNFSDASVDPIDGLELINISMIVGIGKEKYITPHLSMILNPSLRINLTSINNTAPVKSYPYIWGLNAGLRYYFD